MSMFAFVGSASSSMMAPAAGQVAADFAITNDAVLTMTVSAFVLAYSGSLLPVLVNVFLKVDPFHQLSVHWFGARCPRWSYPPAFINA